METKTKIPQKSFSELTDSELFRKWQDYFTKGSFLRKADNYHEMYIEMTKRGMLERKKDVTTSNH